MKRILNGLACVLFVVGAILCAGGCEGMCYEAMGVGIVCVIISAVIANCVEGRDDEG